MNPGPPRPGAGRRGRSPRAPRRRSAGRAPLALLALGVAALLVPWPQPWVERFSARGAYPLATHLLAPAVGAVPWSVTLTLVATWLAVVIASLPRPSGRRWLLRGLLPWSAAVVVLGFSLGWGLEYRRDTLAALLALPSGPPDAAQVASAETLLLQTLRATDGSPPAGPSAVRAASACVVDEVRRLTGVTVALSPRVKLLPAGSLLRLGFAGVTSPWLLEPHVDAGLPPAAFLATATHELTHAAGFAREADTDALSVLAGLRCADPAVRYAVALHALDLLLAALPSPQRQALAEQLPPRAVADLRAASDAAAHFRVAWLEHAATGAYAGYLRSRGVSAGMADYGRALTLVVQALAHGVT